MQFTSLSFLFLLLPLVLLVYHGVPDRFKALVILTGSLFFLAWAKLSYVPLVVFSVLVNYALGLQIRKRQKPRKLLILTIILNLAYLAVFKYTFFFLVNLNGLLHTFGQPGMDIPRYVLPIGISFYTFRALSFHIDAYRKKLDGKITLLSFFNYLLFFPQLGAGPIVRYSRFQYRPATPAMKLQFIANGLQRFLFGFIKKVLIANTLGVFANAVFALPSEELTLFLTWLGILSYAMQIYYDFSAYSDMAIGLTMAFGYRAPENFNFPFLARSAKDFWTRWHMSLTDWFRDYLFLPLALYFSRKMPGYKTRGIRSDHLIYVFAVLITWFLVGFWHGSDWNFVVWGVWFAVLLAVEQAGLRKILRKWPVWGQHLYAWIIILISWVFFRSRDFGHSLDILSGLISLNGMKAGSFLYYKYLTPAFLITLVIALAGALGILRTLRILIWKQMLKSRVKGIRTAWKSLGLTCLMALFLFSLAELLKSGYSPFIYFKF